MAKVYNDHSPLDAAVVALLKRIAESPKPEIYVARYDINRPADAFPTVTITLITDTEFEQFGSPITHVQPEDMEACYESCGGQHHDDCPILLAVQDAPTER